MVVARVSGTLMASSLKQNKLLSLSCARVCADGVSMKRSRESDGRVDRHAGSIERGGGEESAGASLVKNIFCFKLDAKSVSEALVTTIQILLNFPIVLAYRQNPGVRTASNSRPSPSQKLSPPPFESY